MNRKITLVNCLLFFLTLNIQYVYSQNKKLQDDPDKEWCYLKKSTTVIGMPFHPEVTEVTYDGSLYTGYGELCFGYGEKDTPILLRQKTFKEGWIPVVGDDWKEDSIHYQIEFFSAPLKESNVSNCINFVKVTMKNMGKHDAIGFFSVASRGKKEDYRLAKLKDFSKNNVYKISENSLYKDSKLMFSFQDGYDKIESIKGIPYKGTFTGTSFQIAPETRTGIVHYRKSLKIGQKTEIVFKMPRVPVTEKLTITNIIKADYDYYYDSTVSFWKKLVGSRTYFEIPEKRIQSAQRASMVHLLLATRTFPNGHRSQTDGIPYPNFFLTSGPQMAMAYLTNGCEEYAKMIIKSAISQQEDNGLYFDQSLAHGGIIPVAHGHVMYMTAGCYLITRDKILGEEVFPSLVKAVEYLKNATNADEYNLLPPTYPYDNEMIDGHYASTNYWALLGLRFCIRMAHDLNHTEVISDWTALEKKYTKDILKGIESSVKEDDYVPTGLYDFITGKKARRGFCEYQCNSDWENMLLSYPIELLESNHPYVKGTLKHIRKGYAEGIMTYRHGQHLHQYITANLIEQYMVQGQQRQALLDFYHLILHSGSTHEGFENLVTPWKDRMVNPDCPTPHAWASAKIAFLIRNFLVHEYGGRAGIEKNRDLYLYSVISPAWVKEGKHISIIKAPTEMGEITSRMDFHKDGATVSYSSNYTERPSNIRIRIPYFKILDDYKTDATNFRIENGCLVLSPDFTYVEIKWHENTEVHKGTTPTILRAYRSCSSFEGIDKNGIQIIKSHTPFLLENEKSVKIEPLSFELVKNVFLYEFNRRTKIDKKKK